MVGWSEVFYYLFLIAALGLVIYYRLIFYQILKIPFHAKISTQPGVSIVVCAQNESENLKSLIPKLYDQNYSNYEVIIINDHSTDNTVKTLNQLKKKYSKLKYYDFDKDKKSGGKKEPLAYGIEKAKKEWLLLTDADCQPKSKHWITLMMNPADNSKVDGVLGIGYYFKAKGVLNWLVQKDTLLIAFQYLSFAKLDKPYMGVGRNIAYKKNQFQKINGFNNHIHINGGDDDLFVRDASKKMNFGLQISSASATLSKPPKTFKEWYRQKSRHLSTGLYYSWNTLFYLGLFQIFILLFYVSFFIGIALGNDWILFSTVFVIKFLVQYAVYKAIFRKLDVNQNLGTFLVFEFLWVILNFTQIGYKLTFRDNKW